MFVATVVYSSHSSMIFIMHNENIESCATHVYLIRLKRNLLLSELQKERKKERI